MKTTLAIVGLFAGLSWTTAQAANLVTNPGFETGTLAGWSFAGNPSFNAVSGADPHSGIFHWLTGEVGGTSSLSQTIATSFGETYTFSFYLRNNLGGTNSWEAQWNGSALDGGTNESSFAYTLMSYSVVGTGSDTITFLFRHDPSTYRLDDVSVEVQAPEPASLALLGLGVAGFAALRRRRS